jgi:ribose 5-phosphate isomerase B
MGQMKINLTKGVIPMHVAIGCDHHGVALKAAIAQDLRARGIEVTDCGSDGKDMSDYPVFIRRVAKMVQQGQCDRGIVLCGTGIGACIAANKVHGIRCALCGDLYSARLTRMHNDSNVLSLGADLTGTVLALQIVRLWLETPFEGGRHQRRIDMVRQMELEEKE